MAQHQSPKIITNGLIFYVDGNNNEKCFVGEPTTNLVAYAGLGIYNNVGSDVTATITATDEYYRGARIYKTTYTPITATGVNYLNGSGGNPGLGVVGSGGGGTANRYTGHSIFFKSTVPLRSDLPIYNGYSNIPGWNAGNLGSNIYEQYEDGWFRATTLWYDTVTRSDGKYWAINPLEAKLNVPITIYWAGSFKEDNNNSNYVSRFTSTSRSTSQAVLDLTGTNTITVNSLTYSTASTSGKNPTYSFVNTSNNSMYTANNLGQLTSYTISYWCKRNQESKMAVAANTGTSFYCYGDNSYFYTHGGVAGEYYYPKSVSIPTGTYGMWTFTYDGTKVSIYRNSVLEGTQATTGIANWSTCGLKIGGWGGAASYAFDGEIPIVQFYNRALTAGEIQNNFNVHRRRFGV